MSQLTAQDVDATRLIIAVIAIAIVAYWRTMIKYLIGLAATTIIATLAYGAIMLSQKHYL